MPTIIGVDGKLIDTSTVQAKKDYLWKYVKTTDEDGNEVTVPYILLPKTTTDAVYFESRSTTLDDYLNDLNVNADGMAGGIIIKDNVSAETTTYSSSKIDQLITNAIRTAMSSSIINGLDFRIVNNRLVCYYDDEDLSINGDGSVNVGSMTSYLVNVSMNTTGSSADSVEQINNFIYSIYTPTDNGSDISTNTGTDSFSMTNEEYLYIDNAENADLDIILTGFSRKSITVNHIVMTVFSIDPTMTNHVISLSIKPVITGN